MTLALGDKGRARVNQGAPYFKADIEYDYELVMHEVHGGTKVLWVTLHRVTPPTSETSECNPEFFAAHFARLP